MTTALDIAASNSSYLFVSVPFYTVVKSSSLVFVLFFSILFKLQPLEFRLFLVVFLISGGIAVAVSGEVDFNLEGLALIIAAAVLGGFRWSLTQVFMEELRGKLDSLMTIYFISPAAAVTLLPFSLVFEGSTFVSSKFVSSFDLALYTFLNLFGAGLFAFAMIFVELRLIKKTSSLSISVISYIKQVLQILLSTIVFKTKLSVLNITGLLITICGTFYYMQIRVFKKDENLSKLMQEDDGVFEFDESDGDLTLSTDEENELLAA